MLKTINNIILYLLLIVLLFTLSGCGFYNLNNFVIPNDEEFIKAVESMNTPEKISDYMIKNFTYQAHIFYAPDPYKLWLTNNGDCNDFSTFGVFIANYHGYETYQIHIYYKGTSVSHYIAVYVEDKGLSFSDNQHHSCFYSQHYFNSFKEIVDFDMQHHSNYKLKKYKVYDYNMNIIERENNE